MVEGYWGRRVLVAGGLGFIGLNLVEALLDAGAEVRVLNRSLDPLGLIWLGRIAGGRAVQVRQGEIGDARRLRRWLAGTSVVFNLAGLSGAARSLAEAGADMQVNVGGHLRF